MSLKSGSSTRELGVPARIKQRARPHLLLLDDDFQIVHYENAALALLEELFGRNASAGLPAKLESAIRACIQPDFYHGDERATLMPAPGLIVHISRVQGGDSSFLALLLERDSRRAPLTQASRRFALTKRESEVLQLMLRGMHAADIAEKLSISQTTVTGYFKVLLRKTQAKSRSEMIAKVLGWDEADATARG